MNFIILGGGCFGTFYARQLLRAKNLSFEKIIIVDIKDSQNPCQAFQELGDGGGRIQHVTSDWKDFFYPYLNQKINEASQGHAIDDHYIPPTFAPHVLMEAFLSILQKRTPKVLIGPEPMIAGKIQTPFEMALPQGNLALSFATWTCPATCIEPPTCPVTKGPKDWDMKKKIIETVHADHVSIFQCRHLAMGVGTIPVAEIVSDYINFEKKVSQPGEYHVAMGSVSSCHGLIGSAVIRNGNI